MQVAPPPEGSRARRYARVRLLNSACEARDECRTYDEWVLSVEQWLLDSVTDQEIHAIRKLVWEGNWG